MRVAVALVIVGLFAVTGGQVTPAAGRPPQTVTKVVHRGPIRVELAYRRTTHEVYSAHLRIFRSGRGVVDDHLLPLCGYCAVAGDGTRTASRLTIRDLDGDARPEILVGLNLGGAHDIPYTYIYSYRVQTAFSGAGTYDRTVHVWGNFGVSLKDLDGDGHQEFVSADPRFAGRFDCEACSRAPVQIWQFAQGRLIDSTRKFPSAIRADLRTYAACLPDRARRNVDERGCLPAWAADEAMLGHGRAIWPVLEAALENGNLGRGESAPFDWTGRTYIAQLRMFLHDVRYLPSTHA